MGDMLIEVHDSEIIQIERVLQKLNERQGRYGVHLDGFRREIIERFENIGFQVAVKVFETDVEGCFAFDVDVVDRLVGEFDPDRQVHEAVHDVLGLGESGFIRTEGPVAGDHHHGHTAATIITSSDGPPGF